MIDRFGREISYLRISITDRCNLRCFYCMPPHPEHLCHADILTYEEIVRTAEAAASLGITKIRITGGEPLVRRDCAELIAMLKAIPGIRTVAMTTNGILLADCLPALCRAGLDAVNISIDTVQEARWRAVTRSDRPMPDWQSLLNRCVQSGLRTKVNAVLMKETRGDWMVLAALAESLTVDVRFIEQMPIGRGAVSESECAGEVLRTLRTRWPDLHPASDEEKSSPARYYESAGLTGRIGLIAPMTHRFCESCNRIRLTSTGQLKPCLSYETGTDLRELLRTGASDGELREVMCRCIDKKPKQHCFADPTEAAEHRTMNRIGG